jgi:hypothetical protein
MTRSRDVSDELRSERAFAAGKAFAKEHPFSDYADDRTSDRLMRACPFHLQRFADVFKYGAQSAWRRKGELPGMMAYDLEPGDVFKVDPPDNECDRRVCLTNDSEHGIRFGFPGNDKFWCSMGHACMVELINEG